MAKRKRICIIGDGMLVVEYAALCLNRGYDVQARINDGRVAGLPKGVKKIPKPTKAADLALELTNLSVEAKRKNLVELDRVLSPKTPILSSCVTTTAAEQAGWLKKKGRLIGIGAFPTLLEGKLIEFAPSIVTDPALLAAATDFAKSLGKESAFVHDSVGLVMPRILCTLVNEACFAMMEGLAGSRDIDTAMKLGTNYPAGPVEWAEKIGIAEVHAVVSGLFRAFGEERYRVAPLLQQAAMLGSFPSGNKSPNAIVA